MLGNNSCQRTTAAADKELFAFFLDSRRPTQVFQCLQRLLCAAFQILLTCVCTPVLHRQRTANGAQGFSECLRREAGLKNSDELIQQYVISLGEKMFCLWRQLVSEVRLP